MQAEQIQLGALDASIENKQIDVITAQMRLREGGSDAAADQQLATAESELAELVTQRKALIDSIRQQTLDFIETNHGATTADDVEAMFVNEKRDVPGHFKVLIMTEQDWNLLEQALQHQSRLAITGGELSGEESNALAAAESNPRVVLARQRLDANLDAATDMLDAVLAQP